MSSYSDTFFKNVNGKVKARFELGGDGNPLYREGNDGRRHYRINLTLESDNPDLTNVTYKLHSSYYDPMRESNDKSSAFSQKITSFGDYPVTVEAQVGSRVFTHRVALSDLLSEGHKESLDREEIAQAINTIKKY